jgi:hypothetical protein
MSICFFEITGTNFEFLPEGTTFNETLYVEVLKRLIDAVRRKRWELWRERSLILHDSLARTFFASSVAVFRRIRHLLWIIRHIIPTWLQLSSFCSQNARVSERKVFLRC